MTGRFQNTSASIWKRVLGGMPDECWPWFGGLRNGYGHFTKNYQDYYAHRVAYEQMNGPIPDGLDVMHTCNNKVCCNPHHLVAGTAAQNTQDAYRDGLNPSGERHYKAKLTREQIEEIRASADTQTELAKRYGVRQSHISRIQLGQTWKTYGENQ